jgi:hypothetical protein
MPFQACLRGPSCLVRQISRKALPGLQLSDWLTLVASNGSRFSQRSKVVNSSLPLCWSLRRQLYNGTGTRSGPCQPFQKSPSREINYTRVPCCSPKAILIPHLHRRISRGSSNLHARCIVARFILCGCPMWAISLLSMGRDAFGWNGLRIVSTVGSSKHLVTLIQ